MSTGELHLIVEHLWFDLIQFSCGRVGMGALCYRLASLI